MNVALSHTDIKTVRHLRECFANQTIDLVAMDKLLTSLEGKIQAPPVEGRKSRNVVQPSRVFRHMKNITKTKRA